MKDNIFRKTEKKLYSYFDKDILINSYNEKLKYLLEYKERVKSRIKNIDVEITADIQGVSYSEKVQTSTDGTSYVERKLIELTENLENELKRVNIEILNIQTRIDNIRELNQIIDNNIFTLKNDYKEFITLKYKEKRTNCDIALRMNLSESTVIRMKKRILKVVDSWEETLFYKGCY